MLFSQEKSEFIKHSLIPSSEVSGLVLFGSHIRIANFALFYELSKISRTEVISLSEEKIHNKIMNDLNRGGFKIKSLNADNQCKIFYDLDFEYSLKMLSHKEIEEKLNNISVKLMSGHQVILSIQSQAGRAYERLRVVTKGLKTINGISKELVANFEETIIMRCCTDIGIEVQEESPHIFFVSEKFY